MTNKTLTALIVRLAGFALFVKIFDFFGAYFASIFMTAQVVFLDKSGGMEESFNKLYFSGTILSFTNLILSLILIFKADWIASKLVKNQDKINIDLSAKSVMKIIIATIGIIYCARTVYQAPEIVEGILELISWDKEETYMHMVVSLMHYFIRATIGILFIVKPDQLSSFALKKMKSL